MPTLTRNSGGLSRLNKATGSGAEYVVAAQDSSAWERAHADRIVNATDATADILVAYTAAGVGLVRWAKGTYHLVTELVIPNNSMTYFDSVTIECDAANGRISTGTNCRYEGRVRLADGNSTATYFFYSLQKDNVDWNARVDQITAFSTTVANSAFAFFKGDTCRVAHLRTTDNTFVLVSSTSSCTPSNFTVEDIILSTAATITRPVIRCQSAASFPGVNLKIRNIRATSTASADSDAGPVITVSGGLAGAYYKNVDVRDVEIDGWEDDIMQFLNVNGLYLDYVNARDFGSATGGGSVQVCSSKNVTLGPHMDFRRAHFSGLNIDVSYGSCRNYTIEGVRAIDNGQGGTTSSPRFCSGINVGAATPESAVYKCFLDDGGAYTDLTTAANNATADDVTVCPAAPVVNDRLIVIRRHDATSMTGPCTAIKVTYSTPLVGDTTIIPVYLADDDTWKACPNVVDPTSGFTAAAGTYIVKWDLPDDNEESHTVNSVSGYVYGFQVSATTGITTQPLADRFYTVAEIQDMTIIAPDCHNGAGTTQKYGVSILSCVRRAKIIDGRLAGNDTAAIYNGGFANYVEAVEFKQNAGYAAPGDTFAISKTVDHASLTDSGGATAYMDFDEAIPAGSIVKAVKLDYTQAFDSDDTSTLTIQVGSTGDPDAFNKTSSGEDAHNTTTDAYWGESDCQEPVVTAATTPRVLFTEDDDGTDIISSANAAGTVTVTITYMKA